MREELIQKEKERLEAFKAEEYQVVIQPHHYPTRVRLTYSKFKGGRITHVEEIDLTEAVLTCCKFKGKTSTGTGCEHLKELKQAYSSMKTTDWINNAEMYIDEYYRLH
jgi:hypothetical protein